MKKSQIKNFKPSLKTDKRIVSYLNDSDYKKLNDICNDRQESESEIIREALKLYFSKV